MTETQKRLPRLFAPAVCIALGAVIALVMLLPRPVGWVEDGGCRFYYDSRNEPVTGWQEIDGKSCYFYDNGQLAAGWTQIDGIRHCLDQNGVPRTGWFEDEQGRYYLDAQGIPATGWQEIDEKTYYLNNFGDIVTGQIIIDGICRIFNEDGSLATGWYEDESGRYYLSEDGAPITGWQEIDGKTYYLDADGHLYCGWLEEDGKAYYFREDGAMATGIVAIDGRNHFFDSKGRELLMVNPWNTVPEDYTVELVSIGGGDQIAACAYDDFQEMMAACKADGNRPIVASAYRSIEYQQILYDRKIDYFLDLDYAEDAAIAAAGTVVAVPGTSEHQLGLALDLADRNYQVLDTAQESTPTQQWLMANSWRYGFILRYPNGKSEITGIIYEPWHYRYVGRELAAELYELDLCLEEYLEMLTTE